VARVIHVLPAIGATIAIAVAIHVVTISMTYAARPRNLDEAARKKKAESDRQCGKLLHIFLQCGVSQ
jgi:uncharacterized membrane protein YwzB